VTQQITMEYAGKNAFSEARGASQEVVYRC